MEADCSPTNNASASQVKIVPEWGKLQQVLGLDRPADQVIIYAPHLVGHLQVSQSSFEMQQKEAIPSFMHQSRSAFSMQSGKQEKCR